MSTETTSHKPQKSDPLRYPLHMRGDVLRRNNNIDAGNVPCSRCDGTGNELLSMWRACQACEGTGVSRGNESNFKD